jgi:hypothetical protein
MCFTSAYFFVRLTLFSFLIFFSFSGSPVSSASASAIGNLGAETIVESPFVTTDTPVVVVVAVAVQTVVVKAAPLPPPVFPPSCSFFAFFASRFFFCFKAAFEGFAKIK